jgi:hypothetical protein
MERLEGAERGRPETGANTELAASVSNFLLTEFRELHFACRFNPSSRNRHFAVYMGLASALGAATILGQAIVPADRRMFLLTVGIALVVFSIFGLVIAYLAVQAHLTATVYLRAMNRIRHCFYRRDESIRQYLVLPISDNWPKFSAISFNAGPLGKIFGTDIFAFLNAGAFHWRTTLIVLQYRFNDARPFVLLGSVAAGLVFLFGELVMHRYQGRRTSNAFRSEFPAKGEVDLREDPPEVRGSR